MNPGPKFLDLSLDGSCLAVIAAVLSSGRYQPRIWDSTRVTELLVYLSNAKVRLVSPYPPGIVFSYMASRGPCGAVQESELTVMPCVGRHRELSEVRNGSTKKE